MTGWLLGSSTGRAVLFAGAAVVLVGGVLLYVYGQGEAAAAAAAAAAGMAATARANKARAAVKPDDQEDMARDPHNRDRR